MLDLFLTNIDSSHPGSKLLLKRGGIAVERLLVPGALSAVDKTMEETFMKFAKSAGKQQIKCLNMIEVVDIDKKSKEAVQRVITAISPRLYHTDYYLPGHRDGEASEDDKHN